MNSIEIQILKFVQETFSCDFLDAIFKFVSYIGNKGAIWIVCALILCIFKKTRKAGIISAISLIFCLTIGNMTLKPLIGRMRPYEFDTSLKVIIPLLKDASFPSGHTMAAFAFCHSTAKIYKKYRGSFRRWKNVCKTVFCVLAFCRIGLRVIFVFCLSKFKRDVCVWDFSVGCYTFVRYLSAFAWDYGE